MSAEREGGSLRAQETIFISLSAILILIDESIDILNLRPSLDLNSCAYIIRERECEHCNRDVTAIRSENMVFSSSFFQKALIQ